MSHGAENGKESTHTPALWVSLSPTLLQHVQCPHHECPVAVNPGNVSSDAGAMLSWVARRGVPTSNISLKGPSSGDEPRSRHHWIGRGWVHGAENLALSRASELTRHFQTHGQPWTSRTSPALHVHDQRPPPRKRPWIPGPHIKSANFPVLFDLVLSTEDCSEKFPGQIVSSIRKSKAASRLPHLQPWPRPQPPSAAPFLGPPGEGGSAVILFLTVHIDTAR